MLRGISHHFSDRNLASKQLFNCWTLCSAWVFLAPSVDLLVLKFYSQNFSHGRKNWNKICKLRIQERKAQNVCISVNSTAVIILTWKFLLVINMMTKQCRDLFLLGHPLALFCIFRVLNRVLYGPVNIFICHYQSNYCLLNISPIITERSCFVHQNVWI